MIGVMPILADGGGYAATNRITVITIYVVT